MGEKRIKFEMCYGCHSRRTFPMILVNVFALAKAIESSSLNSVFISYLPIS